MTLIEPAFPIELLKKSSDERLLYFDTRIVLHREFERVTQALKDAVLVPNKGLLRTVIGQTGVGKSGACRYAVREILKHFQAEMEKNRAIIPIVMVDSLESPSSHYYWMELFRDSLIQLGDVLIEMKINYDEIYQLPRTEIPPDLEISKAKSFVTYLRAYTNALKYRDTKACVWDEATDITKTANRSTLMKHLNFVKSLANRTKVLHILVGPYQLYELSSLNGQIIRRSKCIHFRRYNPEIDEDVDAFIEAIEALLSYTPLKKVPHPLPTLWEFFLERCVGSIGIARDWIYNTVSYILDRGGDTLNENLLRETALSAQECKKILLETKEKEKALIDTGEDVKALQAQLGLDKVGKKAMKSRGCSVTGDLGKKRGNVKPFKRKPDRNAVGF